MLCQQHSSRCVIIFRTADATVEQTKCNLILNTSTNTLYVSAGALVSVEIL